MSQLKNNYKILKEHNLIIVVHEGTLNLASMLNFIKTINTDPLFSPKFNHIVDLRNIIFDLSTVDIITYVQHLDQILFYLNL